MENQNNIVRIVTGDWWRGREDGVGACWFYVHNAFKDSQFGCYTNYTNFREPTSLEDQILYARGQILVARERGYELHPFVNLKNSNELERAFVDVLPYGQSSVEDMVTFLEKFFEVEYADTTREG